MSEHEPSGDISETPEEYIENLKARAEEVAERDLERRSARKKDAARNYASLLGRVRKIVSTQREEREE
ncbi:hypothetical protein KW801_00335 [Candidatus Saccharibacteria bacterium]|nr:hypothetical protein [Candidatus Saccharibacteria bacterium]